MSVGSVLNVSGLAERQLPRPGTEGVASMQHKRNPLKRWPRTEEGFSRYRHPYGYVIRREKRSWSERVGAVRGASCAVPMFWWTVKRLGGPSPKPSEQQFETLAEARAWCDAHPWRDEGRA